MRIIPRIEMPYADDRLTSMGTMIVGKNGGPLRTFSGNLAHENGWWPGLKNPILHHWEGMGQRNALVRAETDFKVIRAVTEARRFLFPIGNEWFEYTCDLEVDFVDSPTEIWEVKRSDRDLEDPEYRIKLAGVDEICRRIGVRFRIVMADEIFTSRIHRDNVELFASRRFTTVTPEHMRRLEGLAMRTGVDTTYGELSVAIEPGQPNRGKAVTQALVARRRVEIDLRRFVTGRTPVRIH